eukprot:CAMPEP_0201093132 /NCGR_PEP_ID=MMETSP0812-20130820/1694_1 /ASSEMBLY_ACC=CAM_ASM_000668 /TAXON_ID=98059 /ORGANISM="Dinobryon sp., Strain UTEXLB2267" /LENGTH=476 /DNA_ID=CAMNT_0047345159 /DNA_START=18 /DNA_END=1448 /DNA_ORIENTATION=+
MSTNTTTASNEFAQDFLNFLDESCSAHHAVEASSKRLLAAGFSKISERDEWFQSASNISKLERGQKYFFTRNGTTIIAFSVGKQFPLSGGAYTILGAHTDSPCLKIKPVTCLNKQDALMLNTTPYGGGLWHTWFDRDLGLAGRVILRSADGSLRSELFRIDRPIARIPNLAIHLTSGTERDSFAPNLQEHAKALLSMDPTFINNKDLNGSSDVGSRIHPALLALVASSLPESARGDTIVDVEAQLIDVQKPCLGGAAGEFLFSGRLDNLCSAYQCLRALIDAADDPASQSSVKMSMLFDHEEVGSASCQGAGSSLLMDTLTRINRCLSDQLRGDSLMCSLRNSFVVSADMAHGLHPNYSSKHDSTMAPHINQGLVIKHNANQRYATNAVSASLFRQVAKLMGIPMQEFSVRSDSGCGSTIGPIIATLSGILTVDCGTPQFSMHSIREMMGTQDAYTGYVHMKGVLIHHPSIAINID